MPDTLKQRIQEDIKSAMRAKDKPRLGVLRMVTAEIKQREIDGQVSLDDIGLVAVLDKMIKQRREALAHFQSAGRRDLAEQEDFEIQTIQEYMPAALSEAEIDECIEVVLRESGAASMKDMGKVMGLLKPRLLGRADMGRVSAKVKRHLANPKNG